MPALVDPAFGSRGGFDPGEVIVNHIVTEPFLKKGSKKPKSDEKFDG